MFGNNELRKQNLTDGKFLYIKDVFPTIQGEGPHAGMPAVFVRLIGCNLKCEFCDTDFESNSKQTNIHDLVRKITDLIASDEITTGLVVITGGEPFLQNIYPFICSLLAHGLRVQIETAGTLWIPDLQTFMTERPFGSPVDIVVSPKTPKVHEMIYKYADAWKYIIRLGMVSEYDGLPIGQYQRGGGASTAIIARPPSRMIPNGVWVQPCDEQNADMTRANMNLAASIAMQYGYHVSLQQHKILGVD